MERLSFSIIFIISRHWLTPFHLLIYIDVLHYYISFFFPLLFHYLHADYLLRHFLRLFLLRLIFSMLNTISSSMMPPHYFDTLLSFSWCSRCSPV